MALWGLVMHLWGVVSGLEACGCGMWIYVRCVYMSTGG